MKKKLIFCCVVLLIFVIFLIIFFSLIQKKEITGLLFNCNGDGTCYFAGIAEDFDDNNVVIPSESPDGDIVIGILSNAFMSDSICQIEKVFIPETVEDIKEDAFDYCASLRGINVDNKNAHYKTIDGNLFSKDQKTFLRYSIGKKDSFFEMPYGTIEIKAYAFKDCKYLEDIVLSDTTIIIDNLAFEGSLKINYSEHKNCRYLKSNKNDFFALVYCDDKNSGIFDNINEKTRVICSYAFGYKNFSEIRIPDGVVSINDRAFYKNSCTIITIPLSIEYIGPLAFDKCNELNDVYYAGTKKEWTQIYKCSDKNENVFTVHCSDGILE